MRKLIYIRSDLYEIPQVFKQFYFSFSERIREFSFKYHIQDVGYDTIHLFYNSRYK